MREVRVLLLPPDPVGLELRWSVYRLVPPGVRMRQRGCVLLGRPGGRWRGKGMEHVLLVTGGTLRGHKMSQTV